MGQKELEGYYKQGGHDGNPNDYRDFEIRPPENRMERSACESRTPTENVI